MLLWGQRGLYKKKPIRCFFHTRVWLKRGIRSHSSLSFLFSFLNKNGHRCMGGETARHPLNLNLQRFHCGSPDSVCLSWQSTITALCFLFCSCVSLLPVCLVSKMQKEGGLKKAEGTQPNVTMCFPAISLLTASPTCWLTAVAVITFIGLKA